MRTKLRGWAGALAGLLCAALVAAGPALGSFTPPERIVVVTDDNYPPYLFRGEDGRLKGLIKDKWDLWSRTTGVEVRLEGGNWEAAQQHVLRGTADVIEALSFTAARGRDYEFPQAAARIEARIYFSRTLPGIHDAASLRGISVGAKAGSACAEWLQDRGVASIRGYTDSTALLDAAAAEEIRVFCMDTPTARYLLFSRGIAERFRESPPLYAKPFDWAVRRGNVALRDFIQAGFDRVGPEPLREIEERWQGAPLPQPLGTGMFLVIAALVVAVLAVLAHQFLRNDALCRRLQFFATRDALTGLPNRDDLLARLTAALDAPHQESAEPASLAVAFVDLDHFKSLNDAFGRGFGDRILRQAAVRLSRCAREGDVLGRFGGDEFLLILGGLARPEEAGGVARRILAELQLPFDVDGQRVYCNASVGIAVHGGGNPDAATLVQSAEMAMCRAKLRGRNAFQFFAPEMQSLALKRMRLETALRGALARNEFVLHYQPRIDAARGNVTGFEALLRWQRPDAGLLAPGEFIPVLEDTGLIVPVGEWVLREVCAQICRWEAQGLQPLPVAINLSPLQFRQKGLVARAARILMEHRIDPELVEIELTESSLMHDVEEGVRCLEQLASYGLRLSLDDFGTGHSSLAYLRRFPLHALKIDRTFVWAATKSPVDAAIVRTIIQLAHGLGLRVVAEGVESEEQRRFLAAHDCDEMQGFLFGAPAPAAQAALRLAARRATPSAPGNLLPDPLDEPARLRA